MKILIDTDVILDLLLDRPGFSDDSAAIWLANEQGRIQAFISAITPVNVYYIVRKLKDGDIARQCIARLLNSMQVCSTDQLTLENALTLQVTDYEDAVQISSAIASEIDVIVTRNLGDYKNSPIPVHSPSDFLSILN